VHYRPEKNSAEPIESLGDLDRIRHRIEAAL
jgi:hypothetical protein